MALQSTKSVLADRIFPAEGMGLALKRVALVVIGIAVLAVAAKIKIAVPPSPVPVTMGTFAVLTIGAAYGARLGLVTMLGYMLVGALGFDVFAGSSAEKFGLAYMTGTTGGYLVGYVLAALAMGQLARAGWDRSVLKMAVAMLVGNALIYLPGVAWLYHMIEAGLFDAAKYASVWDQALVWGLTPYLIGDAMKLALAALLVPGLWKLLGKART